MSARLEALWAALSARPLLWLALTLLVYLACERLSLRSRRHPLANPVLLSVALIGAALQLSATPYERYFSAAQPLHLLLGPATVALALPLHRHRRTLRRLLPPIALGLLVGALASILSALALGALAGLAPEVLRSLLPKSITTPIALGVAERTGGIPALTAVFVILTGISGAMLGPALLRLLRVDDPRAGGFAIGLASHGIGTARALQLHEQAGVFAGLAMALNGVLSAVLIPLLVEII